MIFGMILYVEPEKGNSQRTRDILKINFGLVLPRNDPFNRTQQELLVWEDEQGIGRYRVHFYEKEEHQGEIYESIQFKYWLNSQKMDRTIFEMDPMNKAVVAVRDCILGEIIERTLLKKTIDQLFADETNEMFRSYHS